MLETSNSQLTQPDRQSVSKILINNKIAFNPAFFHRISDAEIQTKDDILHCLDKFPKNFKTKFDTAPIDLSEENKRRISALKQNTSNVINIKSITPVSLNQASA
jgi:hypothetical protein